jgi:hypothetical protein
MDIARTPHKKSKKGFFATIPEKLAPMLDLPVILGVVCSQPWTPSRGKNNKVPGPPADTILKLVAFPNFEYKELTAKVQDAA